MTKRKVMIHMLTSRLELASSLFDEMEEMQEECDGEDCGECDAPAQNEPEAAPPDYPEEMPEPDEMLTEGRLATNSERVELIYDESEVSGMAGSTTCIGFDRSAPALLSMMRAGLVRSALVFEEGKRHISLYNTPFSDFEICVYTLRVRNELLTTGKIELDYLVEIHGAQAEHCKMTISVRPMETVPGIDD